MILRPELSENRTTSSFVSSVQVNDRLIESKIFWQFMSFPAERMRVPKSADLPAAMATPSQHHIGSYVAFGF